MSTWKGPKIIVGGTAIGNFYFDRPLIVSDIWNQIEKGNNVLLAAPRRVGKTSIMIHMTENCPSNIRCIFENIQGIKSEREFYRRFYELILKSLQKDKKAWKKFTDFIKSIKITSIGPDGTVGIDRNNLNFLDEINKIIPVLKDFKVVLFLDELPEVLHYLNKHNKKEEAVAILKNLRSWRQNPASSNLYLVLAGSVGIHHIVKSITDRTSDLNDTHSIKIDSLNEQETVEYIRWATKGSTVQYTDEQIQYLINRIQYPLPYFINLMLDQINRSAQKLQQQQINISDIDNAFDKVVKDNDHFKDWKNRLNDYFDKKAATFLNEVLTYISHKDYISLRKLYDLARKHKQYENYIEMIQGLERDGYIVEQNESYVFVSPFLKAYWKRQHPIYDGK